MKRVAIPVSNNLSSVQFGKCDFYEVYELENNAIKNHYNEKPPEKEPEQLIAWVSNNRITDIITHTMNKGIIKEFIKNKVNLFLGIPATTTDRLIADYLAGTLRSDAKIIRRING